MPNRLCQFCSAQLLPGALACMDCGMLCPPDPAYEQGGWLICTRSDCRRIHSEPARFCESCTYPLPLPPGTEVAGRYRLDRLLYANPDFGRGFSFGPIYRALDVRKEMKPVAVRELAHPDADTFRLGLPYFRAAYNKLCAWQAHPMMPEVLDFIEEAGTAYLVTEYLPGPSLYDLLAESHGKPFPLDTVVEWGKSLCDLLELMHSQHPRLLKRHLDTEDLLLDRAGKVKVVNFGFAWRTRLRWRPLRIRVY